MKGKKLSRDQALKRYWVYQLKALEMADLLAVLLELWKRRDEKHPYIGGRTYGDIANTVELAVIGWIAQMFEKSADSVNIVDLWLMLFPEDEAKIRSLWQELEPHIKAIRHIRSKTAFHSTENATAHIEARSQLIANRADMYRAVGLAVNFYAAMMECALGEVGADFNAYSREVAEQSRAAFAEASKRFRCLNQTPADPLTNVGAFDLPR